MTNIFLDKVTCRYEIESPGSVRQVTAVNKVTLRVDPKEVLAIVGPSGCGKTTLLRLIAGLETPDEGRIYYNDVPMDEIPREERGIGMVFQDNALVPHWVSRRSVGFFLELRQRDHELSSRLERISEITGIGLEQLMVRRPAQLSGGEQQRVSIARALARDLQVLLCDEPFSNLDAKLRGSARVELKRLLTEFPITTVYVTHDQVEAMALSNRIAVMQNGQLEQVAPYAKLYSMPANLFVATFIGQVPINLFQGSVDDDSWYGWGKGGYRIRKDLPGGTPVTLGVRPEYLVISDTGTPGIVQQVTPMFAERVQLVEVQGEEHTWRLYAPIKMKLSPGMQVSCQADTQGFLFFDTQTGIRIG